MQSNIRRVPISAFMVCCFALTLVLSACGSSTPSQSTTQTPAPKPSPTVLPSPTPTHSSSTGFRTYTGDGFTIDYPAGWTVTKSGDQVTFSDSAKIYNLLVQTIANPNGLASPTTLVNTAATAAKRALQNSKDENAPSPITVGGDSWVQKSFSGSPSKSNQSVVVQYYLLADNHPANSPATKSFDMIYGTAQSLLPTAQTTYFQPMLQSFKFTS